MHSEELNARAIAALAPETGSTWDDYLIRWGEKAEKAEMLFDPRVSSQSGYARHRYSAPGKYVVQMCASVKRADAEWTPRLIVLVLQLKQDYELWNFGHTGPAMPTGAEFTDVARFCCPTGYYVETPIRLVNMEGVAGVYEWEITSGRGKVRFVADGLGVDTNGTKFFGGPAAKLRIRPTKCMAVGSELWSNDVRVTVKLPRRIADASATHVTSVWVPTALPLGAGASVSVDGKAPGTTYIGTSWVSSIFYELRKQSEEVGAVCKWLPVVVPVNEDIDGNGVPSSGGILKKAEGGPAATAEKNDWRWDEEKGGSSHVFVLSVNGDVQGNYLVDEIARSYQFFWCSRPSLRPFRNNTGALVPVSWCPRTGTGALYVGSSTSGDGKRVANVVWMIYDDHAEHLATQPPY
jgi:hypothetical protein